ncbi:substrate-binding domain-containing protein [Lichenicoccus sp.]|uniref:substrate-binding domain-containing protein n=1 Tax=Lichenicoccus sp. TaxID=2781899 RepID=UPI003D0D2BCD
MTRTTGLGLLASAAAMVMVASGAHAACLIGMSNYTLAAPYFAAQDAEAHKKGAAEGCKVISANGQNDMTKQISDIEDMVSRHVDLLLVNARDPEGLVPAVKAAVAAGVKVVAVDSGLDPKAGYITLVQSSNTQNGLLVGRWLANKMGSTPMKIALLSGDKGNIVGQERRDGVFAGIVEGQLAGQGHVNFTVVGQGWGGWNQQGGMTAMEDLLTAHPDINVVIGENDSMVLGAQRALEQHKRDTGVTFVAAADGQKQAIKLIEDGKYGATGRNDPTLVIDTAIDVGMKALHGTLPKDFPKTDYTKPVAITKANASQYYKSDAVF